MKKTILVMLSIITIQFSMAQVSPANNPTKKEAQQKKVEYTCPMHSDVKSDKPGKCPKCGMKLVEKRAEAKKEYTCPMHSDVKSDKPGKCPKCGMKLVEKKKM